MKYIKRINSVTLHLLLVADIQMTKLKWSAKLRDKVQNTTVRGGEYLWGILLIVFVIYAIQIKKA